MKKIVSIIGARPQFIKHAPLALTLKENFDAITIHTGQHYDENMSQIFFNELRIPRPEYVLYNYSSLQGGMTAKMMLNIEEIIIKEKPDAVLVYGDTNSTLAGALVAAKLLIPLIHIEAGLRSFNKNMPEEINRIVADHCASLLLCSSNEAIKNLNNEGIKENIVEIGDVMKDMMQLVLPFLKKKFDEPYIFATLHRPYNTDNSVRLYSIIQALNNLSYSIILALHPRTWERIKKFDIQKAHFKNIFFIDPVGYIDSLSYQAFSKAVITDSGGMQKEAYWLHKKCITIRSETEWTETTQNNCNALIWDKFAEMQKIVDEPYGPFDPYLYYMPNNISNIISAISEFLAKSE